jgi:hypothetical protein
MQGFDFNHLILLRHIEEGTEHSNIARRSKEIQKYGSPGLAVVPKLRSENYSALPLDDILEAGPHQFIIGQ